MWEFIEAYFIRPVYTGEGYNVFNTIVYAVLFIAGLHGVKLLLKKWKIKIDKKLFNALIPYLVFAGLLRALQDSWAVKHWLFITPGIYLLMTAVVVAAIVFTHKDMKRVQRIGWMIAFSAAGVVVASAYSNAFRVEWLLAIVGAAVALTAVLSVAFKKLLKTRENKTVVFGQVLDSVASAIPIAFLGYTEQHVVSGLVIDINPFLFPLVKVALVLGALHVIGREKGNWDWLLKIAVVALGLGPGVRDVARVFIGV
ncbi:DUF63 family protein [archaeon]